MQGVGRAENVDRSEQLEPLSNTINAEELLKHPAAEGHFPKSDIRHWQRSVFRRRYSHNKRSRQVGHYSVQLTFQHRREEFALGTANKTAAAGRAKEIFEFLRANGWEATIAIFKPTPKQAVGEGVISTAGEFIQAVQATNPSVRARTQAEYIRSFRRIVAGAFGIDDPKKTDYRKGGGRARWLERLHAVELSKITPHRIHAWKIAFLARAGQSPIKQRSARISVNSALRGARSLFSPRRTKFVSLPPGFVSPFASVPLEPRQSMRYRSGFDIEALVRGALRELTDSDLEALKVVLLAATCGLRRAEIDALGWEAFNFARRTLHIGPSEHFQPKSEDSIGTIDLEPRVAKFFQRLKAKARGPFVIESPSRPKANASYPHYRCQSVFERATHWLRKHGVRGPKPLHLLRKEFGSRVCDRYGIFASSRMLRHADVATTAAHYLDKKARTTVGLGHLFSAPLERRPES
jgi:integrase